MNEKKDFFISRTGAAKDIAVTIAQIIRNAGYTTWLQDEDFGHASFMARMAQGYSDSNRLIAILSNTYQQSKHCKAEYEHFLTDDPQNLEERVIVLRIDEVAPVEFLKNLGYTDLVPILNNATELDRVVRLAVSDDDGDKTSRPCFVPAGPVVDQEIREVPDFTGREDEFEAIDALFGHADSAAVTTVAVRDDEAVSATVKGLGGVGKTMLVRHYAWTRRERYQRVWWLNAATREICMTDLIARGADVIPNLTDNPDQEAAVRLVLNYIDRTAKKPGHTRWLLIYDNVEGPRQLDGLLPREGADILITSRWQDWHGEAVEVAVESFPLPVAVDYLLSRTRNESRESAERLAKTLDCLPLALNHARAYCLQSRRSFEEYEERLATVIRQAPENAQYPESVFATFDLAITQAVADSSAAQRLIDVVSYYAPDRIPMSLLRDPDKTDDDNDSAIRALANVSLLTDDFSDDSIGSMNVHRMVQAVTRTRIDNDSTTVLNDCVARIIAQWPGGNEGSHPENWERCSLLLPHALSVSSQKASVLEGDKNLALLFSLTAHYLGARGRYASAEKLEHQGLENHQRVLGEEHPDTATSYNNVASNLNAQCRYEEAEPLFRQAVEILRVVLPEGHPTLKVVESNWLQSKAQLPK